jgi:hypothetical protein
MGSGMNNPDHIENFENLENLSVKDLRSSGHSSAPNSE